MSEFEVNQHREQIENEMREQITKISEDMLGVAIRLDDQMANEDSAEDLSQTSKTLLMQFAILEGRLVLTGGSHLKKTRINEILADIASRMTNRRTQELIEARIKKGLHDE